MTHLPARGSTASQRQSIEVIGFISQHTATCPAPCHHNVLGRDPDPKGCSPVTPNTTPREVAGRLWDVTPGQLLAVLLRHAPHLCRALLHLHGHPGETSLGAPLDIVHADTNMLRGPGGACSTAPVFGEPMEDSRVSHVSAQRGSTNKHCLLLGISCPQPGAKLHVLLVHMPFTSPRLPPFPLLSLSSLPHHMTPAKGNGVNLMCAKGRACQKRSCT